MLTSGRGSENNVQRAINVIPALDKEGDSSPEVFLSLSLLDVQRDWKTEMRLFSNDKMGLILLPVKTDSLNEVGQGQEGQ